MSAGILIVLYTPHVEFFDKLPEFPTIAACMPHFRRYSGFAQVIIEQGNETEITSLDLIGIRRAFREGPVPYDPGSLTLGRRASAAEQLVSPSRNCSRP